MNSLALPRLLKASNETMPHLVKARASGGLLSLVAMKMTINNASFSEGKGQSRSVKSGCNVNDHKKVV